VTNVNNPYINLYQTIIKTNESKIIDTKTEIIFELKVKRIIISGLKNENH